MDEPFETLLNAAVRAPSGDNAQPWRFVIYPGASRVLLYVDETRDPSPMNAGQRMSRMAVGAALENMLRAARAKGWSVCLEDPPETALAALKVTDYHANGDGTDPAIVERVTNRRCYDGRPVSEELIDQLQRRSPGMEGIRVCWIYDRPRLDALASLIGRADGLMLSEPSMRRAFLANVRFDLPPNVEAQEYLPLGSLELPFFDRTALQYMSYFPDSLLRLGWARRKFAGASRRLVQSSSGLVVIVAEDNAPHGELLAGRVLHQTWLALTATGLAAQPMMSLAIFENVLRHGDPELLRSLGREEAESLVAELRTLVRVPESDRLVFVMRFGYAPSPSVRTGRLPLETCTTQSGPAAGSVGQCFSNTTFQGDCDANPAPV